MVKRMGVSDEERTEPRRFNSKEFELPETIFIRDIDNRVFQAIVLRCLSKIRGVRLLEGNFIDSILGRDSFDGVRGIQAEQDSKSQTVHVKVEINVCYGVSIPGKAEEIQSKVAEEITQYTGLHVARVHVVIKSVVNGDPNQRLIGTQDGQTPALLAAEHVDDEYTDEF